MSKDPLLYNELADLWSVFSPPAEYEEEVHTFRKRLQRHGVGEGSTLLHLGCGGGSIDYHLKRNYRVTGVDLSRAMIAQAERLNPEVEYLTGDMRDVRLRRHFDAVLLHDAIAYLTSVPELVQAYQTAAAHLPPRGLMLTLPEELKGRLPGLRPSAETRSTRDTVVSVMRTHYDEDPSDNVFESVYVFLIRKGGQLRVEVDRHRLGIFELDEFLEAIRSAGFTAEAERWELSTWGEEPELPLIVAVKDPAAD